MKTLSKTSSFKGQCGKNLSFSVERHSFQQESGKTVYSSESNRWNTTQPATISDPLAEAQKHYFQGELLNTISVPMVEEWLRKTKARRESMPKMSQRMVTLALGCPVEIAPVPLRAVLTQTVEKYNSMNAQAIGMGQKTALTLDSNDPQMVAGINILAVQVIRHSLTNYDELWRLFAHMPDSNDAWQVIVRKVAVAMIEVYPQLDSYIERWAVTRHTKQAWVA